MEIPVSYRPGFDNLAQRMLASYMGTLPLFHPAPGGPADEESQRQFYNFVAGAYLHAWREPAALGLPEEPDDCFGEWELNNRKPALSRSMQAIRKTIDGFFGFMSDLGQVAELHPEGFFLPRGALRLGGKHSAALAAVGVTHRKTGEGTVFAAPGYPAMFPAWKMLCAMVRETGTDPVLVFSRCLFDREYDYAAAVYRRLCDQPELFDALTAYLLAQGYTREDMPGQPGLMLRWRRSLNRKDEQTLSVWFDHRKLHPLKFEMKVPRFRELLYGFDRMEERLQALSLLRTKRCDGCGYCIQTNREKRQLLTFPVQHGGQQHNLCPLFPWLVWNGLDGEALQDMTALLDFAQSELAERQ